MEYSNISGIAQKILSDIMNDAPLSSIMLKVKIFFCVLIKGLIYVN